MPTHNGSKSECKRGHPFTETSTYVNPRGWRICKLCVRDKTTRPRRAKQVVVEERAILSLEQLREDVLADIKTAARSKRRLPFPSVDEDVLLEVAPLDAHLGALGWEDETGAPSYDLAIAARCYRQAVEGLLARAARDRPAAILLRVGDDYLHVDSDLNQTTAGTAQDVDSRYRKVFRVGVSCAAWAVRRCAELAPTKVVVVPGNHDNHATFAVGEVLSAMFEDDARVAVSPAITPRLYQEWGRVMLCMTHGDKEVPASLPLLMASEQPEMWARTDWREIHCGHLHRKRQMAEDEFGGVRVRWLPSLKSADNWHAQKGFVGAQRAAEAYLWSKSRGFLGLLSEPVVL